MQCVQLIAELHNTAHLKLCANKTTLNSTVQVLCQH